MPRLTAFTSIPDSYIPGRGPSPLIAAMEGYRQRLADELQHPLNADIYVGPRRQDTGLNLLPDVSDQEKELSRQSARVDDFASLWPGPETEATRAQSIMPQASLIWRGFNYFWKKTPHRLNRLGSEVTGVVYDSFLKRLKANVRSFFSVGAYGDTAEVKTSVQAIRSSALKIYHGEVSGENLRISGKVGKEGTCLQRIILDRKEIGFRNCDQVTVILDGFDWKCVSYKKGYNTRGFSVRVRPISLTEDYYIFDIVLKIHPEHAPDRPQPDDGLRDRTHWKNYVYDATVRYSVVGVNSKNGRVVNAPHAGTNSYSERVLGKPLGIPRKASLADRTATIRGDDEFQKAFIGIQGVEWHLADWPLLGKDGRYLRELEFGVSNFFYDPITGYATFRTDMNFSNAGLLPMGYNVAYKMWNALVQVNDPDYIADIPRTLTGNIQNEGEYKSQMNYRFG